jgi:hypothetical protein
MNRNELLDAYSASYFDVFVPADQIVTASQKRAAERECDSDMAACLLDNVEQSKLDLRDCTARLKRAQYDGLFDLDAFKQATKKEKARWVACLDVVRGDYNRAKAELAHWREYVRWATEEQRAKVAMLEAAR